MNAAQIHATFKTALQYIASGHLKYAFDKTRVLVDELQMGEYTDSLNELWQNYYLLLNYFKDGVADPQRKLVYNKIVARAFSLNNELREELLLRNSSNFEYTQKRYFPFSKKYNSPSELLISLKYFHSQWSLISKLEDTHAAELKRLRSNYETALDELFGLFWLSTRYENEEKALLIAIMADDYPGWLEKSLVVSALMLNLWRMFDEAKLAILFDACMSSDARVKQRALVAVCFVLARHSRFLSYFPSIRNRLVLLCDDSHTVENFRNIFIQIISTAETDKISKKMQEEILPEMMRISPKLKEQIDETSLMNSDDWNEENPQWQDLLDDSVSDKLKELSELQQEGADVYMSTFSFLKSFPFFSPLSNWFLPFDASHSSVNELFRAEDKSLLTAFVGNTMMCNSDKYSFCLSILQMPESQRGMLQHSFKMEAEQLDEMEKDEALLSPDLAAKNTSKQYIQDLFRFFKLNPKHADFSDMFGFSLLLHKTYLFDMLVSNDAFKESIAEYYFSKNHYDKAVELFVQIEKEVPANAALCQKIGYAHQQLQDYSAALEAYRKADIIQPDDAWTIRKMAVCHRLSNNLDKALDCYLHLDYLTPGQKTVQLQIGNCYMALGKYKEALSVFFKLDALEQEDLRVYRSISWCAFVSGNLSQAEYYLSKVLAGEPTSADYMNAGHIAWCQGDVPGALKFYRASVMSYTETKGAFLRIFGEDKPYLLANGVDADEIVLMCELLDD